MANTGKGPKALTSAKSIREAERRAEMLKLRLDGLTLEQVGERMGVGADTVHRVIGRALTAMCKEPTEELLALELGRCDVLLSEAMQTVKAFHPLVSAGRVVSAPMLSNEGEPVRNPETGDVLTRVLEDKAPKLAAIATAVRVMERRSRLLGLDAATKLQQEVTVTTDAPAQDLSRLDENDLSVYGYLIEKSTGPGDGAPLRDIRQEVRQKLSPDEIGTLQTIFRKLEVKFLAADTVLGLYSAQARLGFNEHIEVTQ